MSLHSSWRPSLLTVAITSATITGSYCIYQLISQYGVEGTFWYIWEGDPYPPAARQYFHDLDDSAEAIEEEAKLLDALEEAYERAKLDSIDGSSDATLFTLWTTNMLPQSLEKKMAQLSYDLDKHAAKVDAVPSSKHPDIKKRKKYLSTKIVKLMERADILVKHFQDGQNNEN
jgi:hypothetical protein